MTSPGGEWAKARVGVELDWSNVDRDLRARLDRSTKIAARAAQRNFTQLERSSAESFQRMARAYDRQLDRMANNTTRHVARMRRELDSLNTSLSLRVEIDEREAWRDLRAMHRDMQAYLNANPLRVRVDVDRRGLADFGRDVSSMHRQISQLGASAEQGADQRMSRSRRRMWLLTAAIVAAAGPIGGALGVAGGAIGALAGGFAALGTTAIPAIATLTVGLGGLKDAAKEFNKQFEEQNEAVLARIGQMMAPLLTQWNTLTNTIKLNFATALQGGFQNMASLLQSLTPQISSLATTLGQAGTTMSQVLVALTPQLQTLIGGTQTLITNLTPGIAAITASFIQMGANAAPAMATIGQGLTSILANIGAVFANLDTSWFESFGQMLASIGPALNVFLTAFTTLAQNLMPVVGPLLQSFAAGVAAMVPGLSTLGTSLVAALQPLLPVLGQLISALAAGLAPVMGPLSQFLVTLGNALISIMPALSQMLTAFVELAGPILGELATQLAPIISALALGLAGAFKALMPLIQPISKVLQALSPVLAMLATQLGQILANVITALVPVVTQLANAWAQILPNLTPLIQMLGEHLVTVLQALAPFIADMAKLWGDMVTAIMPLLPPIVQMVVELFPQWRDIFLQLIPLVLQIMEAFIELLPSITPLIPPIIQLIGLVTRLGSEFLTMVASVVGKVVEFAQSVPERFNSVVEFIRVLPQRIRDAASGMWDGIKDAFKSALNWIITKWNNFELTIGGWKVGTGPFAVTLPKLVVNMPDIPLLASGGPVRGAGTATSDSILARLSNGEYVNPARSVTKRTLPLLEAIRSGWQPSNAVLASLLPGYAGGGQVGREPYGLPAGSSGPVTVPWVQEVERKFGVKAATYAGHQEKDGKNKGIDWTGSVDAMQRFAEYLLSIAPQMEQVIWMNPNTGEQIGVADGKRVGPGTDQPGYYRDDWSGHTDHVHTRQSFSFGGAPSGTTPGIDDTRSPSGTLGTPGGGSTPIGSGIGASSTSGSAGTPSWGNSGGESKYNSASEADAAGVVPVWVENWPASIGGGGGGAPSGTLTTDTTTAPGGTTTAPSNVDTIPLKKNPDGTYTSTDPEWAKLINRESGGKPDIVQGIQDANSGGNEASGLFQIAKSTWAANGGTKYAPTAGEATPEQQAEIAARIFNKSGGSPWGSGAGQNLGREDEAKLRAGIQRKGTGTPTPTPAPSPSPGSPTLTDPTATPDKSLTGAPDQAKVDKAERALNVARLKLQEARDEVIDGKTPKARASQQAAKDRRIRRLEDDVRSAERALATAQGTPGKGALGKDATYEERANQKVANAKASEQKATDRLKDAEDDLTRIRNDPRSKPSDIAAAEAKVSDARDNLTAATDRVRDAEGKVGEARKKDLDAADKGQRDRLGDPKSVLPLKEPGKDGESRVLPHESMPFGIDRANKWVGDVDWGKVGGEYLRDMGKEVVGDFADPFGLKPYSDMGIDQLAGLLEKIVANTAAKQIPSIVKLADTVNINGDDNKLKDRTKVGMTAVLETYRQGG